MIIYIIYTNDNNNEVKEKIDDMYWFEENHVHTLEPQHVNGYGLVKFGFEHNGLYGVSYQDWMNIS